MTATYYDDLGRVYESQTYEVDPDDGTVGDHLATDTWYDAAGRVIKSQTGSGTFSKTLYDGLGRPVIQYLGYDVDETLYYDDTDNDTLSQSVVDQYGNVSVLGDTILQQTQYYYNTAGQMVASATYERLPGDDPATGTVGALDATNSYATASVVWYDGVGRTVASANFGREDVLSDVPHYFFHEDDQGYQDGDLIDNDENGIPDVAEGIRPRPTRAYRTSTEAGYRLPTLADRVRRRRSGVSHDRQSRTDQRNRL